MTNRCSQVRARRGDRGSALLIVVVLAFIALTIVMTSLSESDAAAKMSGVQVRQKRTHYAAVAGVNYINDQIAHPFDSVITPSISVTSGYSGGTNLWLKAIKGAQCNGGSWNATASSTNTGATYRPAITNYWIPCFDVNVSGGSFPKPTMWLRGTPYVSGSSAPTPDIPVWCWVNDVNQQGNDFLVAAYARYPGNFNGNYTGNVWSQPTAAPTTAAPFLEEALVVEYLRESVGFSNYMFFSYNDDMYLAPNTTIAGSIQSNKNIYFPTSNASGAGSATNRVTTVTGNVQANLAIQLQGTSTNITSTNANSKGIGVSGTITPGAPQTGLPAGSLVVALASTAQAAGASLGASAPNGDANFYVIGGSTYGSGAFDTANQPTGSAGSTWHALSGPVSADIEIDNTVHPPVLNITASDNTGHSVTYNNAIFPPAVDGVLYVDGSARVHSKDGTFSGQLTIVAGNDHVTSGVLQVTSNIQYVDGDGTATTTRNTGFMLQGTGGTPPTYHTTSADTSEPAPGVWASGTSYVPNPNYGTSTGGTTTSVLGLIAMNNMEVALPASPAPTSNNMFVTANTYTEGYWANGSNAAVAAAQSQGANGAVQNYGHALDAITPQVSGTTLADGSLGISAANGSGTTAKAIKDSALTGTPQVSCWQPTTNAGEGLVKGNYMPDFWNGSIAPQTYTGLTNVAVSGSLVGYSRTAQAGYNPITATDMAYYGFTAGDGVTAGAGLYEFNSAAVTSPPPGWLSNPSAAFGLLYTLSPRAFSTVNGAPWTTSGLNYYVPGSPAGYLLGLTPPASIPTGASGYVGDNGYGGP